MINTEDILKNLLLQSNDDWEIANITCDDESEEIHVTLKYLRDSGLVDGAEYPIQDFRHERSWRHLDLWQHKTILDARIPRYRVGDKVKSVEVPWALQTSRLSWLMEKNDRHAPIHKESDQDRTSFEAYIRPGAWRHVKSC